MKNLLNLSLLVGSLLASIGGAHAESLRVRVPFAFTANGTKLPSGEYSITKFPGNPAVLLIRGTDARAIVFARATAPDAGSGLPVTFENEGSEGMALVSVRTADGSFELSNPAFHADLAKNASLAIGAATRVK